MFSKPSLAGGFCGSPFVLFSSCPLVAILDLRYCVQVVACHTVGIHSLLFVFFVPLRDGDGDGNG